MRGDPDGRGIRFLFAKDGIKTCKKQNPCSQPTQKKVKGDLPVPDVQMRIYQRIITSAYNDFFSHGCLNQEIKLRICPGFRDQGFVLSHLQNLGNRTVRVIQITEIHAFGGTGGYTGRFKALLNPVDAEGTLVHIPFRVGIPRIIGTGGNTGTASDTLFMGNQDHASIGVMTGTGGTAPDTG
jgi:hypothetical protein